MVVPEGIAAEDAVFLPSMETALSIVHDAGRPTTLWEAQPALNTSTQREIGPSFWTSTSPPAGTYSLAPVCVSLTAPVAGERVAVVGAGLIGLLATSILSHTLGGVHVTAIDPLPRRREVARAMGADWAVHPQDVGQVRGRRGWTLSHEALCRHSPCRFCYQRSADGPRSLRWCGGRRAGWGTWIRAWSCRGWGQACRPPSTPRGTAGRYGTGP
jgi:hypothetical protein